MPRKPDASDTEFEVLKVLWDHGPGTVRDLDAHLRGQGRRWAYTTIQTLLNRLEGKGYVSRTKDAVPHTFCAAVTRERLLGQRLTDLARDLCGGAAAPLVQALVQNHRLSPDDIRQLRQLLDEHDKPKG